MKDGIDWIGSTRWGDSDRDERQGRDSDRDGDNDRDGQRQGRG